MARSCENACSDKSRCSNVEAWFKCKHNQCVQTTAHLERCIRCGCASPTGYDVYVKTPKGMTLTVTVYDWFTIETLKVRISVHDCELDGVLLFNGEQLKADKTMADYNIQEGSTFEVVEEIDAEAQSEITELDAEARMEIETDMAGRASQ